VVVNRINEFGPARARHLCHVPVLVRHRSDLAKD